jgi:hypothetical protein
MAIIVNPVPNSCTPYSIMLYITATDTEPTPNVILKTTLLGTGWLVEGPLKEFLSRIPDSAWATLNVPGVLPFSNKIRIYDSTLTPIDASENRNGYFRAEWVSVPAPGLSISLTGEEATIARTIEIRYLHSSPA